MAVNPTLGWDKVPVFGWWEVTPGVPATGTISFSVSARITRVDGRMIYPGGATWSVKIGRPEDQDPEVRDAVKAAMKAIAQDVRGVEWDEAVWEQWWDAKLDAAIFTSFWANDDLEIVPRGWAVQVAEKIDNTSSGRQYPIFPKLTDLNSPVPGLNLANVILDTPGTPVVSTSKGQPGGIAGLDLDGDVVNAAGAKVGAIDPSDVRGAVQDYLVDNPPEVDVDVAWGDIAGKPTTFPPTAHTHLWGDISDVPTEFPPMDHDHDGSYAGAEHTHTTADVEGLQAALDSKAAATHTHDEYLSADALDGYVADDDPRLSDARTPTSHSHAWAEITDKPGLYPPTEHTHPEYLTTADLPAPPEPTVFGGRIFIQETAPSDPQPGDIHLW